MPDATDDRLDAVLKIINDNTTAGGSWRVSPGRLKIAMRELSVSPAPKRDYKAECERLRELCRQAGTIPALIAQRESTSPGGPMHSRAVDDLGRILEALDDVALVPPPSLAESAARVHEEPRE